MHEDLKPPSVAVAILNFFSSDPDLSAMLGDMSEEFHWRATSSDALVARLWYWREALRNAWKLTVRELMRTPIRTIVIALGCVLVINAVTFLYALTLPRNSLNPPANQWWTLLLLQLLGPFVLGWAGCRLIRGGEWALALTYTGVSVCYAGLGILLIELWIPPLSSIHLPLPLRSLAIWGNTCRQGAFWLGCVAAILQRADRGTTKSAAREPFGMCILAMIGASALFGQAADAPAKWIGTWALNVERSTFGKPLAPGTPAEFTITGQTLRIEQTEREIRLFGDTAYSDNTGSHSRRDDNRMSLDGKQTAIGPISLAFRRVDDSTFEIVSQASIGGRKFTELSRLSVSQDGRTLTETKTQTERDVTSSRVDENTGAALKTSTSVLVFSKSSGQ